MDVGMDILIDGHISSFCPNSVGPDSIGPDSVSPDSVGSDTLVFQKRSSMVISTF